MFIFIFVIWRCRIDGVVIDNTYESGFTVNLSIYVIFGVIRTDMLYFCWDFNPHHHAGGDQISPARKPYIINFNPHHHAGGDAHPFAELPSTADFNPHHHAGGDLQRFPCYPQCSQFQSTPPRRW